MSDRTDEQIRADLVTREERVGIFPSERTQGALCRLADDVGPLLDRAQRAEAEMERLRDWELAERDGLIRLLRVQRDKALADLAHLREEIQEQAIEWRQRAADVTNPSYDPLMAQTWAWCADSLDALTAPSTPEPPTSGVDLRCGNCGASASLPLGMTCSDHRPVPIVPEQPTIEETT